MKDVTVYSVGLVYASACARDDVQGGEVASRANELYPTGVAPWKVADEPFRTGEPNPCDCEDEAGRKHWLLVC